LVEPHTINWIDNKDLVSFPLFESSAPMWFDMHDANSLASWILYFIERALFIQYASNIKGEYMKCKDQNKQSVFIQASGKNIVLFDELKPFWRTFCESMKQDGEE
jgi:hypothetical protein